MKPNAMRIFQVEVNVRFICLSNQDGLFGLYFTPVVSADHESDAVSIVRQMTLKLLSQDGRHRTFGFYGTVANISLFQEIISPYIVDNDTKPSCTYYKISSLQKITLKARYSLLNAIKPYLVLDLD